MIKEVSTWLATRVAGLTLGGNLQVGWRAQDAPVRCHTLVETGGMPDWYLASKGKGEYALQVVSRGPSYQTAREDAWAVFGAITGTAGWAVAPLVSGGQAYVIDTIEALAFPQSLGPDDKGAWEFSANYILRMRKA